MRRLFFIFLLLVIGASPGFAWQGDDGKQYVLEDTTISGVDTVKLIQTKLKLGLKARRKFTFDVAAGDTILYSLTKEKARKMKYKVINPAGEEKEYHLKEDVRNERLDTENGGAGTYALEFRNQSFRKNYVIIDLKKAKGWKRVEQVRRELPAEDSVVVVMYDTVPRVVMEGTYYLGARKNIKAEYKKELEFAFPADSVPCRWAYIAGFGKEYETKLSELVDLKTQQPVGDALVSFFKTGIPRFPYAESERANLRLAGPGVSKGFSATDYGLYGGRQGVYKLSVTNEDEVVGEYVYYKVVAFDFIKKSEVKVPLSQYKKMKIARCPDN